jgi:hypothetical protein
MDAVGGGSDMAMLRWVVYVIVRGGGGYSGGNLLSICKRKH